MIGVIVDEVQEVVNINPGSYRETCIKAGRGKASFLAGIGKKRRGTHFFIGYECGN